MRSMYHLNVRTCLRAIVQYQDTRLNPEVYRATVVPERRTLFAQLLFSRTENRIHADTRRRPCIIG
jgi:hypothetical protein